MFLEFRTENYKSFRDEVVFSLVPAPKQKGLDYSILHKTAGRKTYKALSTAVIYGANASGKTNLIGAMQTFRKIVLRGNILDYPPDDHSNAADCSLELIPNNTLESPKPVKFAIKFVYRDFLLEYSLDLDLGKFANDGYDRAVSSESLLLNEKLVFERKKKNGENLRFGERKVFEPYMLPSAKSNFEVSRKIASDGLDSKELFLTNGFKNVISSSLAAGVQDYFNRFFRTYCHADRIAFIPRVEGNTAVIEDKYLNSVAEAFGINSNKLIFRKPKSGQEPVLCSRLNEQKLDIPAEIFESYGTLRFVNMMYPLIVSALKTGGLLAVDEFDASIHPSVIMNIISIFHNDEINRNGAQLIFNTHNPLYLNGNILRRDEIKFVERDDGTKCSRHYSLSDFGTKGTNARKGKDYMRNYFVSEYGAIKDIDFSDIFRKIMGKE